MIYYNKINIFDYIESKFKLNEIITWIYHLILHYKPRDNIRYVIEAPEKEFHIFDTKEALERFEFVFSKNDINVFEFNIIKDKKRFL